jgi:hypothetical protein
MTDKPHEPRDDGGPAFPGFQETYGYGDDKKRFADGEVFFERYDPGMSLHDWFAGMAMQAFVSRTDGSWIEAPRYAHDVADAMLAEKRRREAENGNGSQQ